VRRRWVLIALRVAIPPLLAAYIFHGAVGRLRINLLVILSLAKFFVRIGVVFKLVNNIFLEVAAVLPAGARVHGKEIFTTLASEKLHCYETVAASLVGVADPLDVSFYGLLGKRASGNLELLDVVEVREEIVAPLHKLKFAHWQLVTIAKQLDHVGKVKTRVKSDPRQLLVHD